MSKIFAARLRDLRKNANLTQLELADKIGRTPGQVSKYELDSGEPGLDILVKLGDIFDVSVDYLVGATNIRSVPKPNDVNYLYIRDAAGIRRMINIPMDQVDRVKALLAAAHAGDDVGGVRGRFQIPGKKQQQDQEHDDDGDQDQ